VKLTRETERIMIDRKIVELLCIGRSSQTIEAALKVGDRRVRKVKELARKAGYLDGTAELPPYPETLFPCGERTANVSSDPDRLLLPHIEWMTERLALGWHKVTLFEELPVKVGRSSFYRFLERHGLGETQTHDRVVPEIVHAPGEALLLDWGHLCTIKDSETGQNRMVWAFAGILGYSRMLAVRLVWTNSVVVTLEALEDILREFGGAPQRVTSDNPKCFAIEADKYQPLLNPAFELFAGHHGFVIECLPPRDPEKKGKIERPMPLLRRLFEAHGEWRGIEEAERYLRKKVEIANERKHGTTGQKPSLRFADTEAAALKALAATSFERQEMAEPIVRKGGHVRFHGKYYSVGEGFLGKRMVVLGTPNKVSIYHKGTLIEVHDRVVDPERSKSTKAHHRAPWEQKMDDRGHQLGEAASVGPRVQALCERILSTTNGFIELRMVWGILHLAKIYAAKDVDDACDLALETHACTYRDVKNILELTSHPSPKEQARPHAFTRDMSEYSKHINNRKQSNDRCHSSRPTPTSQTANGRAGATHGARSASESAANGLGDLLA
jgi:transposase